MEVMIQSKVKVPKARGKQKIVCNKDKESNLKIQAYKNIYIKALIILNGHILFHVYFKTI